MRKNITKFDITSKSYMLLLTKSKDLHFMITPALISLHKQVFFRKSCRTNEISSN